MPRALTALSIIFITISCKQEPPQQTYPIKVLDADLHLDLVATEPDIVTPIGIAFDAADNMYVLESNTHTPPKDYGGAKFDRIKKGIDEDGDGIPDQWVVFADSIVNGINLDIDADGKVYLAAKKSVAVYEDRDGDGSSDAKTTLLTMPEPENVYDHAGILGIALGPDGWVYVSRGNLGSKPWAIIGADGSSIQGMGIGGVVVRCKTDGSRVELLASGFWNPFDIRFTLEGRLLLTDNDPDSRGPNRLIELVPGGDYGFKDLYGGNGLHPYVSWNGELPGTLPMAAPLGEAPCALIDASYTNFDEQYFGNILVNVWEENNIVRIPMHSEGTTTKGSGIPLVQGDSTFHPVGLATNSKGDLYITDWVLREYPNHGKGKIWRLSSNRKQPISATRKADTQINRFAETQPNFRALEKALKVGDQFQQAMARRELAKPDFIDQVRPLIDDPNAGLRLQALLTFLIADAPLEKASIEKLLSDEDADVRRMALVYTGTKLRVDLLPSVQKALAAGKIGADLFDTYLATVHHVNPEFIENYKARTGIPADKLKYQLPGHFIEKLISDATIPEDTRTVAIPYLEDKTASQAVLLGLLKSAETDDFKLGLMKALRLSSSAEVADAMKSITLSTSAASVLRAQAVLTLSNQAGNFCTDLVPLLTEEDNVLRQATIRYLCRCQSDADIAGQVDRLLTDVTDKGILASWAMCKGENVERPTTTDQWLAAVDGQGDARRGQLVFESTQSLCQSCHMINGWGGTYGPSLSHIGSSKSREQLAKAILEPSAEVAPEWQGWYVIDSAGVKHTGRQIDVNGSYTELLNLAGDFDKYTHPRSFGVLDESLMPVGLQNSMTSEDFNHLIAYLESLK
jgi:putative membrane-bound dehydrogenase-like protein